MVGRATDTTVWSMRIIDSDRVIVPQIHHLRLLSVIHRTRRRPYPAPQFRASGRTCHPSSPPERSRCWPSRCASWPRGRASGGDELFSLQAAFRPHSGLRWRAHDLAITEIDEFLGLGSPPHTSAISVKNSTTVWRPCSTGGASS